MQGGERNINSSIISVPGSPCDLVHFRLGECRLSMSRIRSTQALVDLVTRALGVCALPMLCVRSFHALAELVYIVPWRYAFADILCKLISRAGGP